LYHAPAVWRAVTEFPGAHGPADYLVYVDGKAIGVVEAKPVGTTLRGVEGQSASYAAGLDEKLPAWRRPLPFQYESTGQVTQFTNWMEPHARSRDILSFNRPGTLIEMVKQETPLHAWLRGFGTSRQPACDTRSSALVSGVARCYDPWPGNSALSDRRTTVVH